MRYIDNFFEKFTLLIISIFISFVAYKNITYRNLNKEIFIENIISDCFEDELIKIDNIKCTGNEVINLID